MSKSWRNVAHLNNRMLELSNWFMLPYVYSQIREWLRGKIKTVTIGQIRDRMKAWTNAVSPPPNDRHSTKKNEKTNPTGVGAVWGIKLNPFSEYELR